ALSTSPASMARRNSATWKRETGVLRGARSPRSTLADSCTPTPRADLPARPGLAGPLSQPPLHRPADEPRAEGLADALRDLERPDEHAGHETSQEPALTGALHRHTPGADGRRQVRAGQREDP